MSAHTFKGDPATNPGTSESKRAPEGLRVTVRSGRPEDVPILIPLGRRMLELHCQLEPEYVQLAPTFDEVWGDYLERFLKESDSAVLVAETEGQAIGYALLTIRERPPVVSRPPELLIAELYVEGGFRGLGVGQCLLKTALDWARERGTATAALHVFDRNQDATKFYRRMGFRLLERVMIRRIDGEAT